MPPRPCSHATPGPSAPLALYTICMLPALHPPRHLCAPLVHGKRVHAQQVEARALGLVQHAAHRGGAGQAGLHQLRIKQDGSSGTRLHKLKSAGWWETGSLGRLQPQQQCSCIVREHSRRGSSAVWCLHLPQPAGAAPSRAGAHLLNPAGYRLRHWLLVSTPEMNWPLSTCGGWRGGMNMKRGAKWVHSGACHVQVRIECQCGIMRHARARRCHPCHSPPIGRWWTIQVGT